VTRSRILARMMSRPQGAFPFTWYSNSGGRAVYIFLYTPPRMLFTSRSLLIRTFCTTFYTRSCGSYYAHYAHIVLSSIVWSITLVYSVARLLTIRRLFYHYYSQLLDHFLVQSCVETYVGHFRSSLIS